MEYSIEVNDEPKFCISKVRTGSIEWWESVSGSTGWLPSCWRSTLQEDAPFHPKIATSTTQNSWINSINSTPQLRLYLESFEVALLPEPDGVEVETQRSSIRFVMTFEVVHEHVVDVFFFVVGRAGIDHSTRVFLPIENELIPNQRTLTQSPRQFMIIKSTKTQISWLTLIRLQLLVDFNHFSSHFHWISTIFKSFSLNFNNFQVIFIEFQQFSSYFN